MPTSCDFSVIFSVREFFYIFFRACGAENSQVHFFSVARNSRQSFSVIGEVLADALLRRSPGDDDATDIGELLPRVATLLIAQSHLIPGPRGIVRVVKPTQRRGRARSDAVSNVLQRPRSVGANVFDESWDY